jgi:hypothetical protein
VTKSYIFIGLTLAILSLLWIYGKDLYDYLALWRNQKKTVAEVVQTLHPKVHQALRGDLQRIGLDTFPDKIAIIGLKSEQILQVYVWRDSTFRFLKSYPWTANSGSIGPKLREGDRQIPEGRYQIEHLNPNSRFYLSIKVSYPSPLDIQFSNLPRHEMGSDIFIHGKSSSIGCIAIGDESIEEIFLLAHHAIDRGIDVILCPHDFRVKADFPDVEHISWRDTLYQTLTLALRSFPKP